MREGGATDLVSTLAGKHHQRFVRYVRAVLHDEASAEDVVQATWLGLHLALHRGMQPRKPLQITWRILQCRIRDELRRRKRHRWLSLQSPKAVTTVGWEGDLTQEQLLEAGEPSAPDELVDQEDRQVIREAMAALPAHYRLMVEARVDRGLSMREAGALALAAGFVRPGGNPTKFAENHYYRALARLRTRLHPELPLLGA